MKDAVLNVLGILALFMTQLLATPLRLLGNADRDKLQHHIAGAWVGLVGAAIVLVLGLGPLYAGVAAFTLALAVGFVKEGLDHLENRAAVKLGLIAPRAVERADAVATWLGSTPVAAPLILLGLLR